MSENELHADALFTQLVLSLQMGAMQQMGKVASLITGKVERDMIMAKASIDMLGMLETKTKGNLSEDEQKLIQHILYELRLNYIDESKKKEVSSATTSESDGNNKETGQMAEESAENKDTGD